MNIAKHVSCPYCGRDNLVSFEVQALKWDDPAPCIPVRCSEWDEGHGCGKTFLASLAVLVFEAAARVARMPEELSGADGSETPRTTPSGLEFTLAEARDLLAMFSDQDGDTITVSRESGFNGRGLYAFFTECPEEGSEKLGPDEEPR